MNPPILSPWSRLLRIGVWVAVVLTAGKAGMTAAAQPNILWISSEDHGPHMGCYGDSYATTPNVDALAKRGMIYAHCWSNAPVCAPARTTIITGMYPTSLGAEHMRSMVPFPAGKKMFPQFLREAGYYCTNNSKEDYNIEKPGQVWDESSDTAHWTKRKDGQPFFAVFNSLKSHESQIRTRPHTQVHDPAKVRVPAYHPDTPEVRQDWAQYYDQVTEADADAGARLAELEKAGLTEDTIVFYFADHGSGMPRSKRWPYNSGLQVPLVVYIPEKFAELRPPEYQAGGVSKRLVSFVDFAPTMLSLAGIKPPDWMQGHAFLGEFIAPPQPYVHGLRGRMDERPDLVRSVTNGRYVYVRNYMPHLIYGQHLNYMWQTTTTRVWEQLHQEGKLNAVQDKFWKPKPPEELYDLMTDADEVKNLADSPDHTPLKLKLRAAQMEHAQQIRDMGFLPEGDRLNQSGGSPYDLGHSDSSPFPLAFAAAENASMPQPGAVPEKLSSFSRAIASNEAAVRYWTVLGRQMRGKRAVNETEDALASALKDSSASVRIAAARALVEFGDGAAQRAALTTLLDAADWSKNDVFTATSALDALTAVSQQAARIMKPDMLAERIKALPSTGPAPSPRFKEYIPRLLEELRARFP